MAPTYATYKVKFICGEIQGNWIRNQSWTQADKYVTRLAELLEVHRGELTLGVTANDGAYRYTGSSAVKGKLYGHTFTATIWIVEE